MNVFDQYNIENPYHADNVKVINKGMVNHIDKVAKPIIIGHLKAVAQRFVDIVDGRFVPFDHPLPYGGNEDYPVWYGQMHDATGVAIYDDGTTISYLPTKKALDSQPQHDAGTGEGNIIGNTYLRNAIHEGATKFNKGLWMVVFCSVPYANIVNVKGSPWDRGKKFFDTLTQEVFDDIMTGLKAMKP